MTLHSGSSSNSRITSLLGPALTLSVLWACSADPHTNAAEVRCQHSPSTCEGVGGESAGGTGAQSSGGAITSGGSGSAAGGSMGGISNGGGTPSGGRSGSGGGGGTTLGGAGGLPASNGGSAVGQGGSANGGGAGRGGSGANGGNGGSGGSGANAGRGGSAAGGSSGGHAGRGGSGGATGGAGTRGGSGGMGGSTAMGGSGGMGGSTAMGGSGGGTVSELAEGQPARADSEETAKGNVASKANDGNPAASSRWCPADGKTGHWWQVDLGQVRDVSSLELTWEWDQRLYGYELTVSTDGTTFSQVLDRTDNPSRARVQTESITAEGRYFRLQVTALPTGTPITWGCLSELKLFGR